MGQLWQPLGAGPVFARDNRYPRSDFARLPAGTPAMILTGAGDGDGVGNAPAPTAWREAPRENLLFGTALDVRSES